MEYKVVEICQEKQQDLENLLAIGWTMMTEVKNEYGVFQILMRKKVTVQYRKI